MWCYFSPLITVLPCLCLWTWGCPCHLGKCQSDFEHIWKDRAVVTYSMSLTCVSHIGLISMGWAQMRMKMRAALKEHQRTVRPEISFQLISAMCCYFCLSCRKSLYMCWGVVFNFSTVKALIDQEVKNGIPSHRILLGGFSQVSVECTLCRWSVT